MTPRLTLDTTITTDDNNYTSDHYPIILEMNTKQKYNTDTHSIPTWHISKGNWETYQYNLVLELKTEQQLTHENTNTWATNNKRHHQSSKLSLPSHPNTHTHTSSPHPRWNQQLEGIKKEIKNPLRQYRKQPNNEIAKKNYNINPNYINKTARKNSWKKDVQQT